MISCRWIASEFKSSRKGYLRWIWSFTIYNSHDLLVVQAGWWELRMRVSMLVGQCWSLFRCSCAVWHRHSLYRCSIIWFGSAWTTSLHPRWYWLQSLPSIFHGQLRWKRIGLVTTICWIPSCEWTNSSATRTVRTIYVTIRPRTPWRLRILFTTRKGLATDQHLNSFTTS